MVSIDDIKNPDIKYSSIKNDSTFEYEYPQPKNTLRNIDLWNEALIMSDDKCIFLFIFLIYLVPSNISLLNYSRLILNLFSTLRTSPNYVIILYPLFLKVIPLFFISFDSTKLVNYNDIHRNQLRFEYLQIISDTISFFNLIPLSPNNIIPLTLLIDIALNLLNSGEIKSDVSLDIIPAPLMQQFEIVFLDYFFMKSRQDLCEKLLKILKKFNPEIILDFDTSNNIIKSWTVSKLNQLICHDNFNIRDYDNIFLSLENVIRGVENYPFELDNFPKFLVNVTNVLSKIVESNVLIRMLLNLIFFY